MEDGDDGLPSMAVTAAQEPHRQIHSGQEDSKAGTLGGESDILIVSRSTMVMMQILYRLARSGYTY